MEREQLDQLPNRRGAHRQPQSYTGFDLGGGSLDQLVALKSR